MKILQFAVAGALALAAFTGGALAQSGENILTVQLEDGPVVIELRPDIAPKHVQQIKELAAAGEYDNVAFHRVIKGFMAQTGDVEFGDMKDGFQSDRAGTGGSSKPNLPAEFSDVPFERGTVGMARAQDPDSANSQFFIMLAPGDFSTANTRSSARSSKAWRMSTRLSSAMTPIMVPSPIQTA